MLPIINFNISDKNINVYITELIALIKMLNCLFSKIVKDIEKFAIENGRSENVYYERITRFDFKDFNSIYESDLLKKIGKIMNPF